MHHPFPAQAQGHDDQVRAEARARGTRARQNHLAQKTRFRRAGGKMVSHELEGFSARRFTVPRGVTTRLLQRAKPAAAHRRTYRRQTRSWSPIMGLADI